MQTDVAQPAVGAACVGMLRLLRNLGCEPDLVAGHSYGELVALHAAGVLSARRWPSSPWPAADSCRRPDMELRARWRPSWPAPTTWRSSFATSPMSQAANWNGPRQTVIAGPTAAVKQAIDLAAARGISARLLPVSCAFHTPLVAEAREPLSRLARQLLTHPPDRPVYSNLDAAPHPADTATIAARLGDHLAGPVRFADMIEAMYRDGARVFVEVGPGSILTPLVESVLRDRPHLAVSSRFLGLVRSARLAPLHRAPGRGRTAAPARAPDRWPIAQPARPAEPARGRRRRGHDSVDLAGQRQSRPASQRSRTEAAGHGAVFYPSSLDGRHPAAANGRRVLP